MTSERGHWPVSANYLLSRITKEGKWRVPKNPSRPGELSLQWMQRFHLLSFTTLKITQREAQIGILSFHTELVWRCMIIWSFSLVHFRNWASSQVAWSKTSQSSQSTSGKVTNMGELRSSLYICLQVYVLEAVAYQSCCHPTCQRNQSIIQKQIVLVRNLPNDKDSRNHCPGLTQRRDHLHS